MDRPIEKNVQNRRKVRNWIRTLAILAILITAYFVVRKLLAPSIDKQRFSIAQVERGTLDNAITATGLVVPAFEEQINAPIATQVQELYLPSGTTVKKGDKILRLNNEFITLQTESLRDRLQLRKNNIEKLNLEFDKTLKDLGYDAQMKKLEISGLEAQLADMQRLQKIGGATEEEVENAKLNLDIARLENNKLENELAYQEKVVKTDRRNLQLEQTIQEKELKELQKKLTLTTVTAPNNGVITWLQEDIGVQVQEGEPLVRVANLDRFKIEARASDRYADQILVGQEVKVRINNRSLDGTITTILPAVENNQVGFLVQLVDQSQDLKANMRVEVFIVTDRKEDVLMVRNGTAFSGAQRIKMYKVIGEQAFQVDVNVGLRSIDKVEISGPEIKAGDRLIVSNMDDYNHLAQINLKQ